MDSAPEGLDPLVSLLGERLGRIGEVILVGSGKGGVGKSLVSSSLALALSDGGSRVGLLDLDLHGPAAARLMGVSGPLESWRGGVRPVESMGVEVMSLALAVGDLPVPVSGEGKGRLTLALMALTDWGDLDYLVVDLPPGTGDEVMIPVRHVESARALAVTTPSSLARDAVRRLLVLFRDQGVDILGIVENQAYVDCGGEVVSPLGRSFAEELAAEFGTRVLARIPLDPAIGRAVDEGIHPLRRSGALADAVGAVAGEVLGRR